MCKISRKISFREILNLFFRAPIRMLFGVISNSIALKSVKKKAICFKLYSGTRFLYTEN